MSINVRIIFRGEEEEAEDMIEMEPMKGIFQIGSKMLFLARGGFLAGDHN